MTFGERAADKSAKFLGSWKYVGMLTVFWMPWMAFNSIPLIPHWDQYPFLLLNDIFSIFSLYAAPLILMSQNRQEDRDRQHQKWREETEDRQDLHMLHTIQGLVVVMKELPEIMQKLDHIKEILTDTPAAPSR